MSKPIVAVVGRPNVGKSTLFNKLCGQRLAIVEDTPGITRDRIFANCEWSGHEFLLVDTGGIEPKATEGILAHMREQAQIAIDTADCIIMVADVRNGLTAADEDVAHMLRRSHKPVILAVNKCDNVGETPMELYEFYNLGFDEVMPISSVHGHGTGDLLDAVCAHLDFSETVVEEDRIPVAIIGRPNVGKSSLTNRILGREPDDRGQRGGHHPRCHRHPGGQRLRQVHLHRHRRSAQAQQHHRRPRALHGRPRHWPLWSAAAWPSSSWTPPSASPSRTARWPAIAHDQGKACIIVVNKWDAVEGKETNTMELQRRGYAECFSFMGYAPIIFISRPDRLQRQQADAAHPGCGQPERCPRAHRRAQRDAGPCHRPDAAAQRQGPPPEDLLPDAGLHPSADVRGLRQLAKQLFHFSYQRYLINQIRENFGLEHTPIRLVDAGARLRRGGRKGRIREGALLHDCISHHAGCRCTKPTCWAAWTPASWSANTSTTTTSAPTASGAAGMTNMLRTFGKKAAALTAAGDVLKGVAAVCIGRWLFGYPACGCGRLALPGRLPRRRSSPWWATPSPSISASRAARAFWWRAGAILAIQPILLPFLTVSLPRSACIPTGMVSLGSITMAAAYPVLTLIYGLLKGFAAGDLAVCVVGALIMGGMVIYMHRANIQRIRAGKEYRFGQKHKKN